MSYEESIRSVTLVADASCSGYTGAPGVPGSANPNGGKQYRFVKITGKDQVGLATTKASDICAGVLQNKPQGTGHAATVAIRGISNVVFGGGTALAAGDPVTTDGEGRAIKATGGDKVYGQTLRASSTTGELVPVLLQVG